MAGMHDAHTASHRVHEVDGGVGDVEQAALRGGGTMAGRERGDGEAVVVLLPIVRPRGLRLLGNGTSLSKAEELGSGRRLWSTACTV